MVLVSIRMAELLQATKRSQTALKVFIAGHQGMVGQALCRLLSQQPGIELVLAQRSQLDLTRQAEVEQFFAATAPDWVIIAAAKVGGIVANQQQPAEFLYQNLLIQANILHAAWQQGVERLMVLGSSCIYPKLAQQPMAEAELLTGALEPTNEPYAIAKIAGIKLCESYFRQYGADFRAVMPTNLYGPADYFHPNYSHVIPGLLLRIHQAKLAAAPSVPIWGSGLAKREFLHVDDAASAIWRLLVLSGDQYQQLTSPQQRHINVGCGEDVSIAELADMIAQVVGYQGQLSFDPTQPEGTARKLLDISKLQSCGWQPQWSLPLGLAQTYQWFLQHQATLRC
jgi:GDP-L-fucose synthase